MIFLPFLTLTDLPPQLQSARQIGLVIIEHITLLPTYHFEDFLKSDDLAAEFFREIQLQY